MNKSLVLAIAALIAIGAWFARPGASAAAFDAPLVVDVPPAEAAGKIHVLPLQNAFRREPIAGDFDAFASGLLVKHEISEARREVVSMWHNDTKVLIVEISIGREGSQTALDITTRVPASPLTRQKALQAKDAERLAAAADLAVTDYLSAMLLSQPLGSSETLREALDARAGFDDNDHKAFVRRISQAIGLAYGDDADTPTAPQAPASESLDDWYGDGEAGEENAGDKGGDSDPELGVAVDAVGDESMGRPPAD